jgi:hypothetical protein
MLGSSWVAAQLAASQEGLSSTSEWVRAIALPDKTNRCSAPLFLLIDSAALFISDSAPFVHDESPPHTLRIVREHMNQAFGLWGPVRWPVRSPDLKPLNFWLWRHLKALVIHRRSMPCRYPCREKRRLEQTECAPLSRRGESCVQMHRNHIQHRPYVSRHWLPDACWLEIFVHLNVYYTPLKPVSPSNILHKVKKIRCLCLINQELQHEDV